MSVRRVMIGSFLLLLSLAAACGSGGSDSTAPPDAGASGTSGSSGTPDGNASSSSSSGSSSSSSGTPSAPAPVTAEDFVRQGLAALCDVRARCCGLAGLPLEGCPAEPTTLYPDLLTDLAADVASGRVTYDPAAAKACLAAIATGFPACDYFGEWPAVWEACEPVLTSDLLDPKPCKHSYQCQPVPRGNYRWDAERERVCYQGGCAGRFSLARVTAGTPCTTTCLRNRDTYYCNGANDDKACWNEDGLACIGGTCSARKGLDEPCQTVGPGDLDECADGLQCDPETDKCAARKGVGVTCATHHACVATAYCGSDLKCKPRKATGQPCDSTDKASGEFVDVCADSICENGTCVAIKDPRRMCGFKMYRVLNL